MYDNNRWPRLQTNCLGPLIAPRVSFIGMAFSGTSSGPVPLWNKAYFSIKSQTNIPSERVQPCAFPQCSKCHFFNNIINVVVVWVLALLKSNLCLLLLETSSKMLVIVQGFFNLCYHQSDFSSKTLSVLRGACLLFSFLMMRWLLTVKNTINANNNILISAKTV